MLKQKEWIDIIVAKTNCSKKEAKLYYDAVFDGIKEGLIANETIKIAGLGIFKLRKTAAKEQINLVTKQAEIVPEHNVITFKPYFEVDPKPEAIEIESDETEAVLANAPISTDENISDEVNEEADEEEVIEEEEAEVEKAIENGNDEESVEENKEANEVVEEPTEETSEVDEKALNNEVIDNDLIWLYNGKNCTTENVMHLLKQETDLDDADIAAAIKVVVDKMHEANKTTCKIKEEKDRFDFVIVK